VGLCRAFSPQPPWTAV